MSAKIRFVCRKCSAVVLFLLFFQAAKSQDRFAPLQAITATQAKALKQEIVLAVATKDTIEFVKDSKTFSAQRGQAPLGQSSQWLTAALVMILVDEGKLALDDKVSKYLPVYASYGKGYITIRQCLSHFTGIYTEERKALKFLEKKKAASLEEAVNEYPRKEIQNNAGEAFRYSGMGPDIAGRVLEIVSKKKFDMLAQQKLFRPMGMRQTTFSTLDASALSPSGGARSSAADYIKFLRMLLNGGTHQGQRILSETSVEAMKQILTAPDNRKLNPDLASTWEYSLGAWSAGDNKLGKAAVLVAPSFEGTAALIDFCRGYAFVYLQQSLSNESKTPAFLQIKNALDEVYANKCR